MTSGTLPSSIWEANSPAANLRVEGNKNTSNDLVNIQRIHGRLTFSYEDANTADHITRTCGIANDIVQSLASFAEIRWVLAKPAARSITVCHDCTDRLIHFVSDR